MPTPSPAPTAAELVAVRQIALLSSIDAARAMVESDPDQDVSDAQWATVLDMIDAWPSVRSEAGDIKRVGSIEFFDNRNVRTRLDFRNSLLALYGYPLLVTEIAAARPAPSAAVTVGGDW